MLSEQISRVISLTHTRAHVRTAHYPLLHTCAIDYSSLRRTMCHNILTALCSLLPSLAHAQLALAAARCARLHRALLSMARANALSARIWTHSHASSFTFCASARLHSLRRDPLSLSPPPDASSTSTAFIESACASNFTSAKFCFTSTSQKLIHACFAARLCF